MSKFWMSQLLMSTDSTYYGFSASDKCFLISSGRFFCSNGSRDQVQRHTKEKKNSKCSNSKL
jgi:hypothetical protein